MQITHWLLILIISIPLVFVILGRLRMELAALSMAALLGVLQFAGLGLLGDAHTPQVALKSVSGFGQPVIITLISLFIITRSLDKTGVTRWIARRTIEIGGKDTGRLIALFAGTTALLSLFMNNLAAGALVLPSAMEAARRTGIKPSKLLIPVAYGSLLGGSATYFTTANIIMSDLLRIANPPQQPLRILDFTPTGGLIAIAGILFLWFFGDRLLPDRDPNRESAFARLTGSELENVYQIGERLWEARVKPDSILVGHPLSASEIGKNLGISVMAIQSRGDILTYPEPAHTINPRDHLWVIGREEKVSDLTRLGLDISPARPLTNLSRRGVHFAEIILAPRSTLVGSTLKELDFRKRFGLTVVALKRGTATYRTNVGEIPLEFGDSLLIAGELPTIQALHKYPDLIVFESSLYDQPVELNQAFVAIAIAAGSILASIAGIPVVLAVLVGAVLTLLFNILSMEEAYRSIEWQAVFLIAGMYAVSQAMVQTGLADLIGSKLIGLFSPFGPLGIAAGAYLLSTILTQFMGGQVTALVTGPITISAAIVMGVNPQAVAVSTAIGCSSSFLTPMGHPLNILMIAPANYKFKDFLRAGWQLTLICFIMLLIGLAIFWHL